MAKKDFREDQVAEKEEMTVEEARAYRASLHKPVERALDEHEKREAFRVFWAHNRKNYGNKKSLEEILWIHLKAAKMDDPSKFEDGIKNFGLKKVR
jgi:hypothetical protein